MAEPEPELDAIVIGGGPAGASAARRLAELGLTPVLLEKAAALPRERASAGLLTAAARRFIEEAGIDPAAAGGHEIRSVTLSVPGAFHWTFEPPTDALRVAARPRLDHHLVMAAERAGARVETGRAVDGLERGPDGGWRVRAGDREWIARHVILAAGLRAPILASLGRAVAPLGMGLALELETPADFPISADLQIELGAHPGGWFWLCPAGRRLSAGLVSPRGRAPGARRLLNRFLERRGLAATGVVTSTTDLVPGFCADPGPAVAGLVPVGDTLPAVDPLTGLGVEGALRTGTMAAEFVARARRGRGPEPAASMHRWWRRAQGPMRAAARIGEALHRRPTRFLETLRKQTEQGAQLGACVLGARAYSSLFGRVWPTAFERMVRRIERGA